MAHFAEIDENNIVTRVLVVPDEQEHRGQEFLSEDLGLGGTWLQTSYNSNIRKNFASPGSHYIPEMDIFTKSQPFPSWILDENYEWIAPVPMPDRDHVYEWDEENLTWIKIRPYLP